MAAENQDFTLYQGEDEQVDFYVTDSDGSPKTLTGASIEWGMWLSGTRLLTKTTGSGASLVNGLGTNDIVRVAIAKADSISLQPGAYYHECRIVLSGSEQVIAVGHVLLKLSMTKD